MGNVSGNAGVFLMPERRLPHRPEFSEKQITEQCVDYLKLKHIPCWRMNTGVVKHLNQDGTERYTKFGQKGFPDYLLAIPINNAFHIGFVEFKTRKGKLTPDQEEFKQYAQMQGMCYILCRSVEDLQEGLEAYKKRLT